MKKKYVNPPERGYWKRLLAVGLCGCVSMSMYASVLKSQVNLSLENVTLKTAFEQVQKTAGVSIVYSDNVLDDGRRVSCSVENKTLEEVLDLLLANLGCSFKVENGQVIIFPAAEPLVLYCLTVQYAKF